jgi:hypothetical protein
VISSRLLLGAVLAAAALACGSSSTAATLPADGKLAIGTWGGDTAGVLVEDTLVHVHIGCTFGDIHFRPSLDIEGGFNAQGTYMLRAYPIAVGPEVAAQFAGRVNGTTLTLSVTVDDTVQKKTVVLGPVNVVFGRDPKMKNCPICKRPEDRRR